MANTPEMTDLQAAVSAEDTVIDSAVVAFNGLATMIEQAAGDKTASLALAVDVRAKATALAAAIPANTPTPPAP